MFTRDSISFAVYAVVFGTVSVTAAMFIIPMVFMSFFFSGLVIVFTGLSYMSFRLASSKYSHTVLFLNRLLRKLADSIPPSVGIDETTKKKTGSKHSFISSVQGLFKESAPDLKGAHPLNEKAKEENQGTQKETNTQQETDTSIDDNKEVSTQSQHPTEPIVSSDGASSPDPVKTGEE